MDRPVIKRTELTLQLPAGENNPRNSEGDFVALADGRILFAYSKYVGTSGHDDAPCNVAGAVSEDGGRTWTHLPDFLACASDHNTKNIMSVSLVRLDTGEVCLFYLCKQGPQSEVYLRRMTDETALAFGPAELIVPQKKDIYYVINNSRICKLSDGSLLLPAARHRIVKKANGKKGGVYFGTCAYFKGDRDGKNWRQESPVQFMPCPGVSATGLQEPGAVELPDGSIYGYYRTDRGYQFESVSRDGGKSWTRPASSRFSSPDSPLLIRRNPYTGLYYAFWNPIPCYNGRLTVQERKIHAGRNPLVFAVSENGRDFSDYAVLENDPNRGFCYPAVHFLNAHAFLLSYCCGGKEDGTCLSRTCVRLVETTDA